MKNNTENSTPLIWRITDYGGQEVQLKEHTHDVHVLTEKNRKELKDPEILKGIIKNPRWVLADKAYENRVHYTDTCHLIELNGVYWVDVIVDKSEKPYDIVTAMATRTIPRTGGVIYDREQTTSSSTVRFST